MNCPVVCDDFSEMVNKHVSAISCGVVIRFSNGIFFMIDLSFLSPFLIDFIQVSYAGVQLSGYVLANLTGKIRLNDGWDLNARIENLLDSEYQTAENYQMQQRGAFVELRYRWN